MSNIGGNHPVCVRWQMAPIMEGIQRKAQIHKPILKITSFYIIKISLLWCLWWTFFKACMIACANFFFLNKKKSWCRGFLYGYTTWKTPVRGQTEKMALVADNEQFLWNLSTWIWRHRWIDSVRRFIVCVAQCVKEDDKFSTPSWCRNSNGS